MNFSDWYESSLGLEISAYDLAEMAWDFAKTEEREECALIAENTQTCLENDGRFLSERVAKNIREKMK